MPIQIDPEQNEIHALLNMVDLDDRRVLEIGCGNGRLTRRYAAQARQVIAIDPYEPDIEKARANLPATMRAHVHFQRRSFQEFAAIANPNAFEAIILSWSL